MYRSGSECTIAASSFAYLRAGVFFGLNAGSSPCFCHRDEVTSRHKNKIAMACPRPDIIDLTDSLKNLSPSPSPPKKKNKTEKLSTFSKRLSFTDESKQSQFIEEPDTEFYKVSYVRSFSILVKRSEPKFHLAAEGTPHSSILDTTCLVHADDFKADDNGSFRHHGTKFEFIEMDDDGEVTRIDKPVNLTPGEYKLSHTYWVHSSTKTFKRRTVTLEDHEAKVWPVIVL
ncbi:Hypothetical predicted protein [Paramuricea clavata]|uniref:Uncharacterized protein n=1 Tax=Paramuricea clavata TaxID=317549 RepID=A0A7D9D7F1_PARCT|nr:Hypothetical predicted protein [Paramuricea clavata]